MVRSVAIVVALLLAAAAACCPSEKDETAGWSAQQALHRGQERDVTTAPTTRRSSISKSSNRAIPMAAMPSRRRSKSPTPTASSDEPALCHCRLRPLHQAAPEPSQRRLCLLPERAGELQRGPGHARLRLGQQDMTERDPKAARESFDAFKELVTRFPDSKYTPGRHPAHELSGQRAGLATRCTSRATTCGAAPTSPPSTAPSTPCATIRTRRRWRKRCSSWSRPTTPLGMTDLRDDAERVMRKNFPQSEYLHPRSGAQGAVVEALVARR